MSGPKATQLSLKISGIYSDPNTFSEVPAGISFANCSNVVLDKDSILSSRRGFGQYGVSPAGSTLIKGIFDFKDTILLADETGVLSYDSSGNGSVWTAYPGTFLAPSGLSTDRINSFQSNKNLYLTTSNGIYKLTDPTSTPRTAGVSPGLGGSGVTTGSLGFMATNTNVAYRIIWGYRDDNSNLILGAPSDRIIVSNASGSDRDVALTFFIPADITTNYFYQIYRSAASSSITSQPDDELQLIEELAPTAGEITAGTVTYTDSTPDDLRGVIIYTAPSLSTEGILGANIQPPFATCACVFNNTAFYGNTRNKHSLTVTLIGTGATLGIQVNDTLTISDTITSFTITGKSVENAIAGEFYVETALTPAENIAITARSIVNVLNTIASNTLVAAYYASGYDDLPGEIFLEHLSLDTTPFVVTSSRSSCWRPELPTSGSTYNNTSRNEALPNRIYFSKQQQPEAISILNYFDVGSPEEPIMALVPLRDGVIILKTDGVFRISGYNKASFAVSPIDTTVRITAPNSVAVLSNKVFFFTNQGVVAVSDNAAEIISRSIESEILELSSAQFPNFESVTFAIGYESDRKYILWTPTTSSDTYGTQAYVFNTLSGDWTKWNKAASSAIVKQDNDTLYLGGQAANEIDQYVFQERKNFNLSDFADEQYTSTVNTALGLVITVPDTSLFEVGYTLQQTLAQARIVSIDSSTQLTMSSVQDWVLGPVTAFRPIFATFESNPFDAGNPGEMKHWADLSVVFRATDFTTIDIGVSADTTNEVRTVTLTPPSGAGGWGAFPWGTRPWGVSQSVKARLRTSIPKQAMRSNWLSVSGSLKEAFTDINMAGLVITYSTMSSRQKGAS